MLKIALNFICKNEAHIIEKMLSSVRPIMDLIVAVDTGSKDKTITTILEFGKKNNIPTFVFDRPFDNFCNSRNHALDMLYSEVRNLGWRTDKTWGLTIDCDETLHILPQFKKEEIGNDGCPIYVSTVQGSAGSFQRQLLFNLSKDFHWEGPIHELIRWKDPSIQIGHIPHLFVHYESAGASWKGDLEAKFMNYANLLTAYINEGHHEFRWYRYAADSYSAAAEHCKEPNRKKDLLHKADQLFDQALRTGTKSLDEQISTQRSMADNKEYMGENWSSIYAILLETYSLDPRRAESIGMIIKHYINIGAWKTAYIFSSFAIKIYHNRNPYGHGVIETDDKLYRWQLLLYYYLCCHYLAKKEEAKSAYDMLKQISSDKTFPLPMDELIEIRANAPFYLKIRSLNPFIKSKFYGQN